MLFQALIGLLSVFGIDSSVLVSLFSTFHRVHLEGQEAEVSVVQMEKR